MHNGNIISTNKYCVLIDLGLKQFDDSDGMPPMQKTLKQVPGLRIVRSSTSAEPSADPAKIGQRVREMRKAKGWSLERLSSESGIPQSTLSKFETDNLSLPVDRLFLLAGALEVPVTDLFDRQSGDRSDFLPGRRSVTRNGAGRTTSNATYDYRWLFPELLQKHMFPVIQTVRVRSLEEFGPLLQHEGEEFSLVLKGSVKLITDIYEPILLEELDAVYIDSRMGHAHIAVGEGDATILNVSMSIHHSDG